MRLLAERFPLCQLTVYVAVALLLLVPATYAEATQKPVDLIGGSYLDARELEIEVVGEANVSLVGTGRGDELKATVAYVPFGAREITAIPDPLSMDPLTFVWKPVTAGKYGYRYDALVTTYADNPRISDAIPYPFAAPPEVAEYLKPQEFTDTTPQIRALANELVGTERDATRVTYTLASWTRTNVRYDLHSIAADATKPSSWVYENREGVCDELTALFISLSREAGIPARFVSGLAYTTLPAFPQPWQAHGWAEVWLPGQGWVPVDVTYGEVFWLDAAHIPITRTTDASANGADYLLHARDLTLIPGELDTQVTVIREAGDINERLTATLTPQYSKTGSNSGNVLIASVTNSAPYTIVTDVTLLTTRETTVEDARSQMVLIPAGATRLVRWRVQMGKYDPGYMYSIPFGLAVRRGTGANATVTGSAQGTTYPLPAADDASEAGGGIAVQCEEPKPLYVGETTIVKCTSPGATVCADSCSPGVASLTFTATAQGAYPITVNATSSGARGHALLTFLVVESPQPVISTNITPLYSMDDDGLLLFTVQSALLTDATVHVDGAYVTQTWSLPELDQKDFALKFPGALLNAGDNELVIRVEGSDKNGKRVTATETVPITLPASFIDKIHLFFVHLFA